MQLFKFAVSQGPCILIQCIAISIRCWPASFKEGAINGSLQLEDVRHIQQIHCLLQVIVLQV